VFARLLDQERGGTFAVELEGQYHISQEYLGRTNILSTASRGKTTASS